MQLVCIAGYFLNASFKLGVGIKQNVDNTVNIWHLRDK